MVMNRLETLLASNQYRDVASLLESLDGPLADEPENVQLWLYLANHVTSSRRLYHLLLAHGGDVQEDTEYKAACQLVKIVWNREYSLVWRLLGSDVWSAETKPFVDAVGMSLRTRVITDISQAYSSIRMNRACDLLGIEAEALVADCETNKKWRVDRQAGLLRIAQDVSGIHEECDLSELHSITEQMIALS